jgi:predicted transcriptional regulator
LSKKHYDNNVSSINQEITIATMTIKEISKIIDGKVICCEEKLSTCVEYAFSSDLMSDVLTVEKENLVLITGLANLQTIRTSEMSDITCIIFARDKKIGKEMISLAEENEMILIESPHSVFHISGELYKAGIKSIY